VSHVSGRGAISQATERRACRRAPQQVQWGIITLILDNEVFRRGFLSGRQWYFQEDIYGEDGRPPEEPQYAAQLTAEEALRLIDQPDEQGRYHFHEMGMEHLPEYPGYLGGPLAPGEAEHYRKEQAQQENLRRTVTVCKSNQGWEALPSLSLRSARACNKSLPQNSSSSPSPSSLLHCARPN
jgi:hypothetical protein